MDVTKNMCNLLHFRFSHWVPNLRPNGRRRRFRHTLAWPRHFRALDISPLQVASYPSPASWCRGVRTKDGMDNVRMPNVRKQKFVCRKIVGGKVRTA